MANKYANLNKPQRELELHGHRKHEAMDLTRQFIDDCINDGIERVRIITGKGKHSPDGKAKIKPAVDKYLSNNEDIDSYREEKINEGGEGAFFIRLTKN